MAGTAVQLPCSLRFSTIAPVPMIARPRPITGSPVSMTGTVVPMAMRARQFIVPLVLMT